MKALKVEKLTKEAFEAFGTYLGKPDCEPDAKRVDLEAYIGISDIMDLKPKSATWGFLTLKKHDSPVDTIERHLKTAEAFIPLTGQSVMVVAPVSDPNDANAKPDQSKMKAFLMDGSAGVFFPAGSWHWAPFAISDEATFLIIVDENVGDDIYEEKIDTCILQLY